MNPIAGLNAKMLHGSGGIETVYSCREVVLCDKLPLCQHSISYDPFLLQKTVQIFITVLTFSERQLK